MGCKRDAVALLNLVALPTLRTKLALAMLEGGESGVADVLTASAAERVFIQERQLMRLLQACRDESGMARYLLGTCYLANGRRGDALALHLDAYGQGLRCSPLLRNLGYMYLKDRQDAFAAVKYLREDLQIHPQPNEDSLLLLEQAYRKLDLPGKTLELIPYMEQAAHLPLVRLYLDAGWPEKALLLLETATFQNGEGAEYSGDVYHETLFSLVRKQLEQGDFTAAAALLDRTERYPEGLHYGRGANMALAELHYYRGMASSGLDDEAAALTAFRQGAAELQASHLYHTETSRAFSMKCLEQLHLRGLPSP